MYVLAITGGLGAGKSTAAELFSAKGAVVLDLDEIAKTLLDEAPAVRDRVVEAFGEAILGPDGRINRAALAQSAFADAESVRRLDAIVHPAVLAAAAGALDTLVAQARPPRVVVLVIPLLAEAPAFLELVDAVLAISSDEESRLERVLARGMDEQDAERRLALQAGDAERRLIADYVIENDSDLDAFRRSLTHFWDTEVAAREA